jgi:hypothetical protein
MNDKKVIGVGDSVWAVIIEDARGERLASEPDKVTPLVFTTERAASDFMLDNGADLMSRFGNGGIASLKVVRVEVK